MERTVIASAIMTGTQPAPHSCIPTARLHPTSSSIKTRAICSQCPAHPRVPILFCGYLGLISRSSLVSRLCSDSWSGPGKFSMRSWCVSSLTYSPTSLVNLILSPTFWPHHPCCPLWFPLPLICHTLSCVLFLYFITSILSILL